MSPYFKIPLGPHSRVHAEGQYHTLVTYQMIEVMQQPAWPSHGCHNLLLMQDIDPGVLSPCCTQDLGCNAIRRPAQRTGSVLQKEQL